MTEQEFKQYVGFSLKKARERAKQTQQEAATKMGVSQSVVNRWESGKSNITIETIYKYKQAFNYDVDILFYKPKSKGK